MQNDTFHMVSESIFQSIEKIFCNKTSFQLSHFKKNDKFTEAFSCEKPKLDVIIAIGVAFNMISFLPKFWSHTNFGIKQKLKIRQKRIPNIGGFWTQMQMTSYYGTTKIIALKLKLSFLKTQISPMSISTNEVFNEWII